MGEKSSFIGLSAGLKGNVKVDKASNYNAFSRWNTLWPQDMIYAGN